MVTKDINIGLNTTEILGIRITSESSEIILEYIRKYLMSGEGKQVTGDRNKIKPLIIYTPNPEIIEYSQADKIFKDIVNSAQINIPDGAGIVWSVKRTKSENISQITGVDMMEKTCKLSADLGFGIGLIGGKGELADGVKDCLSKTYQNLTISVFSSPIVHVEDSEIRVISSKSYQDNKNYFRELALKIAEKKIDILFVALGFPKQEYFINKLAELWLQETGGKRPLVMMGVGGSFDYIAGKVKRAPLFMRENGLEWLWRLILEPKRFKRQISGSKFFLRVIMRR